MNELNVIAAFGLMCAAIALWFALAFFAHEHLIPHLERWIWRRLGGQGEPPWH